MTRNKLNLTIDLLALVLFAGVLFTGFGMGGFHGSPQGALLLGMGKRGWVHLHEFGSYLLLAAMAVHLVLHATWIQVMFCGGQEASSLRRRLGRGLMACAALLLVASVLAPRLLGGNGHREGAEGAGQGDLRPPSAKQAERR